MTRGSVDGVRIASTVRYATTTGWDRDATVLDLDGHSRPGRLAALVAAGWRSQVVVLDGSSGWGADLGGAVALRYLTRSVVVLTDATWRTGTGWRSRLRRLGLRAFDSPRTHYGVLSEAERKVFPAHWGVDPDRVFFLPWYVRIPDSEGRVPSEGLPVAFSGGDSMRDFQTLLAAARPGTFRLDVASRSLSPDAAAGSATVSIASVPPTEFIERFRSSDAVVVTMEDRHDRSAGQQTYLRAMAIGIPVVVSDTIGVREYIEDGRTGWLVPPGDSEALRRRLEWLFDPVNADAVDRVTVAAVEATKGFSPEACVDRLRERIDEIAPAGGTGARPPVVRSAERTRPQRLRILVVIDGLGLGGAESLLLPFVKAAPGVGLDVEVCCLAPPDSWRSEMVGPLRAAGIEPHFVGMRRLLDPRTVPRLASLISTIGADVVHAHLEDAITLATPAARLRGVPAVGTLHHNTHAMPWRETVRERLSVEVGARAGRTIFVSEASLAVWAERYGRRANWTVLRNGIDLDPYEKGATRPAWPPELTIEPGAPVALLAASMRGGKGHEVAIEAWPQVMAACPGATLLLAGSGVIEADLRAAVASAGLDGAVRFAGFRTDVARLLQSSDAVLLPSEAEAFPTILLEAAAAGRPAVATAVGGIPEIIVPGETGLLIEPGDVDGLAAAAIALLGDPALAAQLGDAARRRVTEEFSAPRWMARLRAVYDEVLGIG